MRHFSGLAGRILAAAAESEAFSLMVAVSGATRPRSEHPEKTAQQASANAIEAGMDARRIIVVAKASIVEREMSEWRVIAGLGSAR